MTSLKSVFSFFLLFFFILKRINAHLAQQKEATYVINLDPAVSSIPYTANIDIRETVNYKEVMKQ